MNGWTLAKVALALLGIALLLLGDSLGRPWIGYLGIAAVLVAFLLRFVQRRIDQRHKDPATDN